MVAIAVKLPLVLPSTRRFNAARQSCKSCNAMQKTILSCRPSVHPAHFAVFSVLSSPSQVKQSEKFVETSKRGNLVPLSQCIFSDHLTPVLAYRCLVNENDHEAPSFLFDSVDPGLNSATVGRYSVIGANPAMEIIAKENLVTVINHRDGWRTEEFSEDPLMIPKRITQKWSPQCTDELPQVFCGGWVGYFSYDTVRYYEKKLSFLSAPPDDRDLPDIHLGLYDDVLVFDHVEKKIHVIHWVQLDKSSSIEEALDNGMIRLDSLLSKVHDIVNPTLSSGSIESNVQKLDCKLEVSGIASEAYKMAVLKAKEHLLESDILQVVLSQRFERRTFSSPFEVYRVLSIADPNPFMAYIQVRGCIFVASSPHVRTYVDKKATDVHSSCWDALQSAPSSEAFTGSAKIEAMKLIDELEPKRRGPYGGSFGCISFTKDMDIAFAPNTIMFPTGKACDTLYSYKNLKNIRREWIAYLQTGAAITIDSDPGGKQRQCEQEAALVARAINLAELSFLH